MTTSYTTGDGAQHSTLQDALDHANDVAASTGQIIAVEEALECLDDQSGETCDGPVEYRYALSGTGVSYPRCDKHWSDRLDVQEGIDRRYPSTPPSDWSPYDAGESWDEEDY